ncbi:MAG TPA: hypothetical protein VFI03_13085 [Solirubrobacterales bacterium]|nr:hypothetical protein [Solirubrobacterales bacterium]
MTEGPRHEIVDLFRAPGELSFEARIAGRSKRVWLRSETAVTPPPDPALAASLMLAMSNGGGTLTMRERVSPRLLRRQREYQAIQCTWSRAWSLGEEPLREVEVSAPPRSPAERPRGRVAAFFSGGVDSWSTVLDNPDVTDLIFVRGHDLISRVADHQALADEVEKRLRGAAAELGLPLHVVDTNLRELSDPIMRWEPYNPSLLAAVALFFEPLFERVLIATDTDHETQPPLGTARLVDHLWSTEQLEVVDDGGRFNREQRLRRIVSHPVVQKTLRVCWENPGGAYNCGRCRKCMMTMISLEAFGQRELVRTFPAELDLDLLADFELTQPIALVLWEDTLETARAAGRPELTQAVEPVAVRGRLNLGLPASYRSRRQPQETQGSASTDPADSPAGADAQAQLETILNSRSWRLTAPLRRLGALRRRR